MQWKTLTQHAGTRTIAVVLETGDEVLACLRRVATELDLHGSAFTAIGAFERAVLGYFDWEAKDYRRLPVDEQVEVLSLVGDIGVEDGTPRLHAHVVVGRRDGSTRGGHLLEAHVRPTLEIVLTESGAPLTRRHDPVTGLRLIRLS